MSDRDFDTSSPFDAVVVGARCAGATTAMLLARAGLRVLVVDKGSYGADALSTHALMRGAVVQLHRWGLLDEFVRAGTPPVRRSSFHYPAEIVEVDIRRRGAIDALYAPRRTLLDRVLVDAARAAGAVVSYGTTVDALLERDGRVAGVVVTDRGGRTATVTADLVIGADGFRSKIAALVGAEPRARGDHAAAFAYGYFEGAPKDGYHWYWGERTSAGAIPTDGDLTNVFVAAPPERLRREMARGHDAAFAAVLADAAPELAHLATPAHRRGALRFFHGERGFLRRAAGPGWALVGDAGFFRDPITAHGITDALRDAELLARAVLASSFEEYEAARDDLARPMLAVTDAIASFEWDEARLRELHALLNAEMKRGVEALDGLDRLAA